MITPTKEVDIDKAVVAIIDVKDHKAIAKAPATTEEALVEDPAEVDSIIEPDINKRSTISMIRQDTSQIGILLKSTNRHI